MRAATSSVHNSKTGHNSSNIPHHNLFYYQRLIAMQ